MDVVAKKEKEEEEQDDIEEYHGIRYCNSCQKNFHYNRIYLGDMSRWAPMVWETGNVVAAYYPIVPTARDRKKYKAFFESFTNTIPCPNCAQHFAQHLAKHPITPKVLENARNLLEWWNSLHNEVRTLQNKPNIPFLSTVALIMAPEFAEAKFNLSPEEVVQVKQFDEINRRQYAMLAQENPTEKDAKEKPLPPPPQPTKNSKQNIVFWIILAVLLLIIVVLAILLALKRK